MTAGRILFAHGARDPRWAAPCETVAAMADVAAQALAAYKRFAP